MLGGKLAAEVVVDKALGNPTKGLKEVQPHVIASAASHVAKEPRGVKGEGAIAFGGGATLSKAGMDRLRKEDAKQVRALLFARPNRLSHWPQHLSGALAPPNPILHPHPDPSLHPRLDPSLHPRLDLTPSPMVQIWQFDGESPSEASAAAAEEPVAA